MAAVIVRCSADRDCAASLKSLVASVASSQHVSEREVHAAAKNCKANAVTTNLCTRLVLTAVERRFAALRDGLLKGASPACASEVMGAEKSWRFRIDNACRAAGGNQSDDANLSRCRLLALQQRTQRLQRLTACQPCAACVDP